MILVDNCMQRWAKVVWRGPVLNQSARDTAESARVVWRGPGLNQSARGTARWARVVWRGPAFSRAL